jgi:Family of unknown function (DUF6463)
MSDPRNTPLVGPLVAAVGTIHVALTPLLYPQAVGSIRRSRVIASIEAEPDQPEVRSLGFWYATCGLALIAYGALIAERERQQDPLPIAAPTALTGLGLWGVLLMPRSGFWALFPLAALAWRRRRR